MIDIGMVMGNVRIPPVPQKKEKPLMKIGGFSFFTQTFLYNSDFKS